jgi:hypothetical protein
LYNFPDTEYKHLGRPLVEPVKAFQAKGREHEVMASLMGEFVEFLGSEPNKAGFVRCIDITGGREVTAIQCVNEVDDATSPSEHFVYVTENLPKPGVRIDRRLNELSCRCEGCCDSTDCKCIVMSFGCW